MRWGYNVLIHLASFFLRIIAPLNKKLNLFVSGRKNVFNKLRTFKESNQKVIWIHVASLGEYEQGLPVLKALKKQFPDYSTLLTFFSPSGYEIKKNNQESDLTLYLPLDTHSNAKKWVQILNPSLVFFVKYEFWLNYLHFLKNKNTPTYLISGIFRPNQLFFKPYGSFYRKALNAFTYLYVQNQTSKNLLNNIGLNNVKAYGDTRFDSVNALIKKEKTTNQIIEKFKDNQLLLILGSSWESDEKIFLSQIDFFREFKVKIVIAPHQVGQTHIDNILKSWKTFKPICYTENLNNSQLKKSKLLIINKIGILKHIYHQGEICYIGGGFNKSGIHNTLEASVYKRPIIFGPNYQKFKEANELIKLKGAFSISDQKELRTILTELLTNKSFRKATGDIAGQYTKNHIGATKRIIEHIINTNF